MSVDPSSFNFDTGLSNISIDPQLNSTPDPSAGISTGPLTEGDLLGGGSTSTDGLNSPTLPTSTVNSYNLDSNQVLNSLGGQNPFASPSGGPPIQNFTPQLTPLDQNSFTNSLQSNVPAPPNISGPSVNYGSAPNILNDAALMGLGIYGIGAAKDAQNQVNQEISPVQENAAQMLTTSNNLLTNYNAGKMPSWAQNNYNTVMGEGNNLVGNYFSGTMPSAEQNYANDINGQANNLLSMYNNGQLNPAEQSYADQLRSIGTGLTDAYWNGTLPSAEQNYVNTLNNESSNLMQQYQSNTLPGYAKSYVDWTTQAASNLINSSSTQALNTLATQAFTDYNSGKLKPADEIALDQQVSSQKQSVATMLAASGAADSSVLNAQYQQIDNNAAVTRQNILNSYFQTGNTAYNSWLNSNTDAATIMNQGAQFSNQVFTTMLQDALQTQEFAASYTQQGLQYEMNTGASILGTAANYVQTGLNQELTAGMQGKEFAANYTAQNLATELQAGLGAQEFASNYQSQTFQDMLNGAVSTGGLGTDETIKAIGVQLQSDNMLSQMVGSLMQSIATSYAYQNYQNNNPYAGGTSGAPGGGGTTVGAVVGGLETLGKYFSGAGGQAAVTALGALGVGYSAYNTVKNWKSGATGADALSAAETGMGVGAMVGGPFGALVGGLIGGAVGAISSAFGGGKTDPETLNWNNLAGQLSSNPSLANSLTPAQAYQSLAGIMDAKNNSPGHSTNLEIAFGRQGEGSLVTTMANWVNQAIQSGQVSANSDPATLYNQVVKPNLQSMGAYVNPTDIVSSNGAKAGGSIDALLTRTIGLWQSGNLSGGVGVSGQTISGLPQYGA
jgi:hypothetical protein